MMINSSATSQPSPEPKEDWLRESGIPFEIPPDARIGLGLDAREAAIREAIVAGLASLEHPRPNEVIRTLVIALNRAGLGAIRERVTLSFSPELYGFFYDWFAANRAKRLSAVLSDLPSPRDLEDEPVVFDGTPLFACVVSGKAIDSRLSYRDPSGEIVVMILPAIGAIR